MVGIMDLPEDCISHILSLTTPTDVLISSSFSKRFYSASQSDAVWDKFLPSDIHQITSQSSSFPHHFASKKALFIRLCQYRVFFDDRKLSFALDKRSAKKNYMVRSGALESVWGHGDTPWFPEAGFVLWNEMKGRIHINLLSPNTTYGAYFLYQFEVVRNDPGVEHVPVKVAVLEIDGDEGPLRNLSHPRDVRNFYWILLDANSLKKAHVELPVYREDGWLELEMGRYHVGDAGGVSERALLEMTLCALETGLTNGFSYQGIELRPLD